MNARPQLQAVAETRLEKLRRLARMLRTKLAIMQDRKLRDPNPNTVH